MGKYVWHLCVYDYIRYHIPKIRARKITENQQLGQLSSARSQNFTYWSLFISPFKINQQDWSSLAWLFLSSGKEGLSCEKRERKDSFLRI